MKQLSTLALFLTTSLASAQCGFTPMIAPSNPIACPVGFLTLNTQVYDSYQWFENGQPINGQNGMLLQVDASSIGNTFTVQCTLDSCTEMSAPVMLDGYVFLLPYVINAGDEPNGFGLDGEELFCEGDTALLIMGLPYNTNIQWTDGGAPIAGANDDTLVVTTTGDWSVSGAPSVCPEFIEPLGLMISTIFTPPLQPEIVNTGDSLCPYPTGNGVQWYVNGAPIATSGDCIAVTQSGNYVVSVDYGNDCSVPSEPYIIESVNDHANGPDWTVAPSPANDRVTITGPAGGALQAWSIVDLTGRTVISGNGKVTMPLTISMSALPEGRYFFSAPEVHPLPLTVVH